MWHRQEQYPSPPLSLTHTRKHAQYQMDGTEIKKAVNQKDRNTKIREKNVN